MKKPKTGKTPMHETNALKTLSLEAVLTSLKTPKNTLITCHVKPDGDCLGSAFALKMLLSLLGSRAWVVCAEDVPSRLRFLLDDEQGSVLPDTIPADFHAERIVAVDTASPGQAGSLFELYKGRYDLMIDHHGRGTPFADHYIVPDASATGELIFALSRRMLSEGCVEEIPVEADLRMYAAISSDTGCFKYSNATPETHLCAAELIRSGIDAAEINRKLFSSVPYLQMVAENEGFRRIQFEENGRVAAIVFPYEAKAQLGLKDEHLETLVDVVRVIEGVEIAFVVKQPSEANVFRLSMRSAVDFDVSEICAVFGGGGHARAAGATIEDENGIVSAVERILREIRERIRT